MYKLTQAPTFMTLLQPPNFIKLIGGCSLVPLTTHEDSRGILMELVKETNPDVQMCYYSWTEAHVPRDADQWHLHHQQTDRFFIVQGSCYFALSDGQYMQIIPMPHGGYGMLYIPPGVYHCLIACGTGVGLINFPTQLYNADDELRIKFDDLGVKPWEKLS